MLNFSAEGRLKCYKRIMTHPRPSSSRKKVSPKSDIEAKMAKIQMFKPSIPIFTGHQIFFNRPYGREIKQITNKINKNGFA